MRSLLITIIGIFLSAMMYAQSMVGLEYFYDVDPGVGAAQYVGFTNQNQANVDFDLITATQNLSTGIHFLYIRTKDSDQQWSQAYRRRVEIVETFATPTIESAEYFIDDNDPGIGQATPLSIPQTGLQDINWSALIPMQIEPGVHYVYIRTKDNFGDWSQTYRRQFELRLVPEALNIVRGEYSVDTDPGFGAATPFAVELSPNEDVNWSELLGINVADGSHFLYLRMKDSEDNWSQTYRRYFEKVTTTNETIVALEYTLNTDDGFGEGVIVAQSASQDLSTILNVNTSALPLGPDTVYIRSLTSDGRWSQTVRQIFNNCGNTIPNEPISYNGNGVICGSGSVTLNSPTRPNCTYQWLRNGVPINGAISTTYDAATSGSYAVTVSNTLGCTITTPVVEVLIVDLPESAVVSNNDSFCPGGSVALNSEEVDEDYSYQWYLNGVAIADSTDSDIVVNIAGGYALQITDEFGCTSISPTFIVDEATAPNAIIIPSGSPISICQGETLVLSTIPSATNSYQWNNINVAISGETSSSISINSSGLYSVTVSNENCSSVSNQVQVIVSSAPSAPTVTFFNGLLFSSSNNGNQWFLNGQPIVNATGPSYEPTQEGLYTVELTNAAGCSTISEPFPYFPDGIEEQQVANLSLYPNPTNGGVFLALNKVLDDAVIVVYDSMGQNVWQDSRNLSDAAQYLDFNLAAGIYRLEVKNDRERFITEFIIQ